MGYPEIILKDKIQNNEQEKDDSDEEEKEYNNINRYLDDDDQMEDKKDKEEEKQKKEKKEEEEKEEEKKEEEKKEEVPQEQKEGEEKKEGEGEGEQKEGEEKKEGEGEGEQKEGEEKKETEGPTETKENQPINSDRSSVPRDSILEDNKSTADEFKNLVMDTNFIMFHFLSSKEEVDQFMKYPDDFLNYILRIKKDIKPPMILSPEKIAEILYQDKDEENEGEEEEENQDSKEDDSELNARRNEGLNKFSLNIKYEYQDLCPVDIVENKIKRIGKVAYSMKYNGKYYKFYSMENMEKFKLNPNKYINLELPVRKVNLEQNKLTEKKILFNNTVNFLEFTFGSLITKGMLELSNNRIKYPYLNVKESSLKYLALFLKANNPKNNRYAQEKYKKILKEFKRNSELPWELYHVYENYNNEKENELNKKLIRKQLDTVSVKYDKLMEKAKIQNNTRFANFFRINNETNEEEKNE
jgi:YHS domain-containing protein